MKRREFMALFGSAAVASPLAVRAQPRSIPSIGYLHTLSAEAARSATDGFLEGLADGGFTEQKNVAVQYRYANGQLGKLPTLAAELAKGGVNAIAAMGGSAAALAATAAAPSTPIVFTMGDVDPVEIGLVSNLARPGGNLTGVSILGGALGAKRLELLRDLVPRVRNIAILVNPENKTTADELRQMENAISARGQNAIVVRSAPRESLDAAFAILIQAKADALVVTADPIFTERRKQIVAFTAEHKLPAIYQWNLFVLDGGLISYGANLPDMYRQAGVYTARILRGEKASDLPVMQPTKFDLFINLKTARTLGIVVPQSLLVAADEVIE